MEIGEFHNRDGWYFKRLEDGAVRIRKDMPGTSATATEVVHTIPANEWASIVSHVSGDGETAATYQRAVEFHLGAEAAEAKRSGVTVEGLRVWKAATANDPAAT